MKKKNMFYTGISQNYITVHWNSLCLYFLMTNINIFKPIRTVSIHFKIYVFQRTIQKEFLHDRETITASNIIIYDWHDQLPLASSSASLLPFSFHPYPLLHLQSPSTRLELPDKKSTSKLLV